MVGTILGTCTIPKHKRYKPHSFSSEAKIYLNAAYHALQSFYGDFGLYATCLKYMGFDPSHDKNKRLFAIGFKRMEIDPLALERNLPTWLSSGMSKDCLDNPVHFFPNGTERQGISKVSLSDFPDDAIVKIDSSGNATFKLYAIAKDKSGNTFSVSLNEEKIFKIEKADTLVLNTPLNTPFSKFYDPLLIYWFFTQLLSFFYFKKIIKDKKTRTFFTARAIY